MEKLKYEDFKERARNEPDIANCFGMFQFFHQNIVVPIETTVPNGIYTIKTIIIIIIIQYQIEGEKEHKLKGWGNKEKGDSSFYQTISFLAYDRRWFVVEDGFLAYYKTQKVCIYQKFLQCHHSPIQIGGRDAPECAQSVFMQREDGTRKEHLVVPRNAALE